jgi:hypothetical protein
MSKQNMRILGCKVTMWKHTYRAILPRGGCFWGTSYPEMTIKEIEKQIRSLLDIFEAGKKEQL